MRYQFLLYPFLVAISACSNRNILNTYSIDEPQSKIEWKGFAPDFFHEGSFSVSGELHGDTDGNIHDGKFTIPIVSIENFDLPEEVKPQLLGHLKSPDFFNIALYPNATFEIEEVISYNKNTQDTTHIIKGAFTMLGKTNTISFPAKITFENGGIAAKASFSIDRLKWGMTSYNDPSKAMYILPDVEIKLDIQAKR